MDKNIALTPRDIVHKRIIFDFEHPETLVPYLDQLIDVDGTGERIMRMGSMSPEDWDTLDAAMEEVHRKDMKEYEKRRAFSKAILTQWRLYPPGTKARDVFSPETLAEMQAHIEHIPDWIVEGREELERLRDMFRNQ